MPYASDLKTNASAGGALEPYLKSTAILFCPSDSNKTVGSYGYKLNGENESALEPVAEKILLNETSKNRHFNGQNIAFVDGHVKWGKGGIYDDATDAVATIQVSGIRVAGTLAISSGSCEDVNNPCGISGHGGEVLKVSVQNNTSAPVNVPVVVACSSGVSTAIKLVSAATYNASGTAATVNSSVTAQPGANANLDAAININCWGNRGPYSVTVSGKTYYFRQS